MSIIKCAYIFIFYYSIFDVKMQGKIKSPSDYFGRNVGGSADKKEGADESAPSGLKMWII